MIKNGKIEYWKGVLIGPLAVLPATLVSSITYIGDDRSISSVLHSLMLIGLLGVVIGYVVIFTYGSACWLLLLRFNKLNLVYLIASAIFPSIIFVFLGDIRFGLMLAYYSVSVCLLCWFVNRREIKLI